MHLLDRPETIKHSDRHNVLRSLDEFPKQMQQAWIDTRSLRLPKAYRTADSVVVSGMGASAWPANILNDVIKGSLKIPMTVISDYSLPKFVNQRTLVLLSSYSGTTEEPINAFKIALKRKAKMLVLTNGGTLAKLAQHYQIPAYIFKEKHNPSHQPRLGTGYMLIGTLGLFERAHLLHIKDREVRQVIQAAGRLGRQWSGQSAINRNKAKKMAVECTNRTPVLIGAEHLESTAIAFRNRLNENAKHLASAMVIPNLNHYFLEGLRFPAKRSPLFGIFIDSERYDKRNRRRIEITKRVFEKNRVRSEIIEFNGRTKLEEAVASLTFSGYMTYWLALINKIDPSKIPWVDYFKAELGHRK